MFCLFSRAKGFIRKVISIPATYLHKHHISSILTKSVYVVTFLEVFDIKFTRVSILARSKDIPARREFELLSVA